MDVWSSSSSYGNGSSFDPAMLLQLCQEPMSFVVKVGITLLIAIAVFGIVVNVCYLFTVLNNHNLRTPPNLLVTNLAVADLLYLAVAVPFYVEHEINPCFQFGLAICKLMNMSQLIAQCVCIYSLMFGSIERYVAITRVGRSGHLCNNQCTMMSIVFIWLISFLLSTPIMIIAKLEVFDLVCVYLPHQTLTAQIHELIRFALLYVIPLIAISWCYSRIFSRLMKSTGTFRNERQPGLVPQLRARRRVAKMLVTITVFFAVCWLPYFAYSIWFEFISSAHSTVLDIFRHVHFCLGLINSCANPVIVYVMSSTHRRALRNTFRRRQGKDGPKNGPAMTTMSKTYASESVLLRNRTPVKPEQNTDISDIAKDSHSYAVDDSLL